MTVDVPGVKAVFFHCPIFESKRSLGPLDFLALGGLCGAYPWLSSLVVYLCLFFVIGKHVGQLSLLLIDWIRVGGGFSGNQHRQCYIHVRLIT